MIANLNFARLLRDQHPHSASSTPLNRLFMLTHAIRLVLSGGFSIGIPARIINNQRHKFLLCELLSTETLRGRNVSVWPDNAKDPVHGESQDK